MRENLQHSCQAVWPRCPSCGRAYRAGKTVGGTCKCGASLEGDVLGFQTRYVSCKQVAVRCGLNGEYVLAPTFSAVFCGKSRAEQEAKPTVC